jgi:glyoxylase-like metal-dependent hydrolase (beta-lactamase superfamily II)
MTQRQLGEILINRIVDSVGPDPFFDPLVFFPETTPEDWERHKAWLEPSAMDPVSGHLTVALQSYLVRTRHHTILVDTCVGDHKQSGISRWNMTSGGSFLAQLAAAGVQPEAVDYVMCTHFHADHVGWNTQLRDGRWVPTFSNAKYVFSRKEYEYREALHATEPYPAFADSVLPVVQAGQAELVTNDYVLTDEVWLEPTPSHTPDHFSVRLASNGAEAVMTGDLLHSPVQFVEPTWGCFADFDPKLARETRRAFFERYCETDVLICSAHLPSPSVGHIVSRGDAYWFAFDRPVK